MDDSERSMIDYFSLTAENIQEVSVLLEPTAIKKIDQSNVFTIGARLYPEDVWAGCLQFEVAHTEEERGMVGKLLYLYVAVPYRERGVGVGLLEEMEDVLYDSHIEKVYATIPADDPDLVLLIENHGFNFSSKPDVTVFHVEVLRPLLEKLRAASEKVISLHELSDSEFADILYRVGREKGQTYPQFWYRLSTWDKDYSAYIKTSFAEGVLLAELEDSMVNIRLMAVAAKKKKINAYIALLCSVISKLLSNTLPEVSFKFSEKKHIKNLISQAHISPVPTACYRVWLEL